MWKTLLGIGGGIAGGAINGYWTNEINDRNAERNHHYWNLQNQQLWHQSEISADKALQRQYKLYNDLQSPKALVEQYKEAGLNPALLYSMGGGGGHVSSAPQGQAQSGQGAPTLGTQNIIDPLTMAQIANINADTKKKEQETENVKSDTLLKNSTTLLNTQLHNQKAQSFIHELAILAARQAIEENEQNLIETNNKIKNKTLELLENDVEIRKMEKGFQTTFKEKFGLDLSSMDGLSATIVQVAIRLGQKGYEFFKKWDIELPEWDKIWK